MRRFPLLVVPVALVACGPMSEAKYEELALATSNRNEARYTAAHEELRRKGYTVLPDESQLTAILEEDVRQQCIARKVNAGRTAKVQLLDRRGGATHVTTTTADACTFFDGRAQALSVVEADGSKRQLVPMKLRTLARGPDGVVVEIDPQVRIIGKRSVVVDRTCNEMPSPGVTPLERGAPLQVMWSDSSAVVPRKIAMPYEREELEMDCAKKVY